MPRTPVLRCGTVLALRNGLLATAWLAAVCCLGTVGAGCSPGMQAGRDLHGSASDGLIYVLADPDDPGRTDLWRARLSDGAVRPFTRTPERQETWPFWSVSASLLVFEVSAPGTPANGPQQLRLWGDGRERDLPGVSAQREAWAAWAPASARLVYAFVGLRQPATANGVALLDLETGEQRILASGTPRAPYIRPEVDPRGVRVVAQRLSPRAGPNDRPGSRTWLLQPGVPPRPLSEEGAYAVKGRFTRDGRSVVFTRRASRDGPGDLILVRTDGTGAHPVASTPESDDHTARASPVRDEIVFVSDRDGKHDLFLVSLDGGEARNLTARLAFEARAPRWAPNGEQIAVTSTPYVPERQTDDERRITRTTAHVLVLDREGRLLLQTRGFSPDWMPPWP